jgi:hypothetical protein
MSVQKLFGIGCTRTLHCRVVRREQRMQAGALEQIFQLRCADKLKKFRAPVEVHQRFRNAMCFELLVDIRTDGLIRRCAFLTCHTGSDTAIGAQVSGVPPVRVTSGRVRMTTCGASCVS